MLPTENRLSWVDTLRGIAVLCVFLLHATLDVQRHISVSGDAVTGLNWLIELTFGVLDFGKIGVANFFIVSGFLIPVTLDKSTPHVIRGFVINRIFRLFPAYWVSILLALSFLAISMTAIEIAINFTMLQRFVGVPDLNGVYWTLQIELIFYAACVGLKWRRWLSRIPIIENIILGMGLLAVALAILRYVSGIRMPVAVALALQLMFFGYLYRIWLLERRIKHWQVTRALCLIGATLCISCPLAYSRDYGFDESWSRYLASYILAISIFVIISKVRWKSRLLSFIGKVSYSFYLTHTIVVSLVISFAFAYKSAILDSALLVGVVVVAAIGSVFVAWVLYKCVEEPGINVGRIMNNRLNAREFSRVRDIKS